MDNIDNVIENIMQKQIFEPIEFEQAIMTAFEKKKEYNIKNKIIKIIVTIIAFIMTAVGVVFAKDISNFIKNIFDYETVDRGVVEMAENGYVQNVNMEYIEKNGVYIKVNNILMDDYNLDIVFEIKTEENIERLNNIEIEDLIIADENNNLIYCNYNRADLYEQFCKEHNIEFSKMNMHNNFTNGGYQIKIIEKTEDSIKFLYKLYSEKYPKSKELIFNFENINMLANNEIIKQLNGKWNIKIDLPEDFYTRKALIYSVKDNSDNENKIIIEEAIGAYTEMHITLLMKDAKAPYEATKEGVEKFLSEISLEDEFVATLENENGQIFEESISSSDGKGGMSQHPNGDVTLYLTFPITKDEYTDTLKLNITTRDKTMVVNLGK